MFEKQAVVESGITPDTEHQGTTPDQLAEGHLTGQLEKKAEAELEKPRVTSERLVIKAQQLVIKPGSWKVCEKK